jgi:hypothetical protein
LFTIFLYKPKISTSEKMMIAESVRLEGDESPPQAIKNFLVSYNSTLHGEEIVTPIYSNEPVFLSGDDGEEYLLLGEDEDSGLLVYGFEDDDSNPLLVYADQSGNIHEIETLDGFGFGGFKGFKGFKMKAPKFKMKAPKLKMKIKAPKIKMKGLTKGFSGIGKRLQSGVKAYGKAWSDVGKGLSKGVGDLAKGAGNILSQVAEGGMSLLNPDGQAQEEPEEEQPEEEKSKEESYQEEIPEEDSYQEEQLEESYQEDQSEEMSGEELGFLQFLPMATGLVSQVASGVQKKQQAKKAAKNQRNTALLNALRQSQQPAKIKKTSTGKIASVKLPIQSKARAMAPTQTTQQQQPNNNNKTLIIAGGLAAVVLGGIVLFKNKRGR